MLMVNTIIMVMPKVKCVHIYELRMRDMVTGRAGTDEMEGAWRVGVKVGNKMIPQKTFELQLY